jgi:hypothetical protein
MSDKPSDAVLRKRMDGINAILRHAREVAPELNDRINSLMLVIAVEAHCNNLPIMKIADNLVAAIDLIRDHISYHPDRPQPLRLDS